ncbi:Glycine--tRNA ligase 1, mitochondrial [Quaeritorhiza haematococci]|nr:Glycine--tRNA ligase 1, mitochondrial [Quaeritorhiza haematococci]
MPRTLDEIDSEIESQGTLVRVLKAQNKESPSDDLKLRIAAEVDKLKKLKAEREPIAAAAEAARKKDEFDRAGLESMLLKRFFYAPSFSIYGGVAGLYDYGPPGCALQNNILSLWRSHFVLEEDMLEVECTNLTPESVLKTSGHVERFADWMVRDLQTGDIFRADHLVKQVLNQRLSDDEALQNGAVGAADKKAKKGQQPKGEKLTPEMRKQYELILEQLDNYQGDDLHKLIQQYQIKAPETGNELSKPVQFNLMFETQIGPTGQFKGFLRPETAQGHFLNFKKLLEFNTDQMPFASASIGKSFRNEISPRQGLLRVREFTMAEIEHYVDPNNKKHPRFHEVKDIVIPLYSAANQLENKGLVEMSIGEAVEKGIVNNETLGYFVARIYLFLVRIGIDRKRLRFRQHMANEMAHYACDCWDAEIKSSYGWIECVGCADRSAFDLSAHSKATREKLVVREALPEPVMRERWVLEINKPKFGPAFKKNAKFVTGYIESLMTGDDEWDELKLQQLQSDLEKGDGKVTVTGTDGNPYELTKDMVQIYLKKEKISGECFFPSPLPLLSPLSSPFPPPSLAD